jgi:hypothetical protein
MPVVSKAQLGAMHAAKEGNSTLGIPSAVGAEFVRSSHGKDLKHLPERKHAKQYHLHKRGHGLQRANR